MCTLGVSVTGVLGRSSSFSEFTGYVSFFFAYRLQPPTSLLQSLFLYLLLPADLIRTEKVEID